MAIHKGLEVPLSQIFSMPRYWQKGLFHGLKTWKIVGKRGVLAWLALVKAWKAGY